MARIDTSGKRPRITSAQRARLRSSPGPTPRVPRTEINPNVGPQQEAISPGASQRACDLEDSIHGDFAYSNHATHSSEEECGSDDGGAGAAGGWIDSDEQSGSSTDGQTDDEETSIRWEDDEEDQTMDEDLEGSMFREDSLSDFGDFGEFVHWNISPAFPLTHRGTDPPQLSEKELMHLCCEGILTGEMSQRTYNKLESHPAHASLPVLLTRSTKLERGSRRLRVMNRHCSIAVSMVVRLLQEFVLLRRNVLLAMKQDGPK